MNIYDKTSKLILDIAVDDESYRYRQIMGKNSVTLLYSLTEHVELPVGSYISYQGERYTLWLPGNFEKEGTRNFKYTVEFGSNQEILNKYKYKNISARPHKLKFSLTAKPQMFIQLLADNLNLYDKDWKVGQCIEATEKTIAFNHEYCFSVLSKLAEEFSTEFEIVGKTINFCKTERFKDSPLTLGYGRGNGFKPGLGRINEGGKSPVTLLYVQGGDRNIDVSSYKSETLLLPVSQEIIHEDRRYKTDEYGMFITRADKDLTTVEEDSFDAGNIYPMREGTVSGVIVTPEGFYDFKDDTIPEDLDFSRYRIGGEKATVIFQTGKLTGREFDIVQTEDALTGYIHAERRFKLVSLTEGSISLPNSALCPEVGDKYAVFHISLPEAYVCNNRDQSGASWEMFREAVRYFREHEDSRFSFSGELDGLWAKKRWLEIGGKIQPGGYVLFSDNQFQPDGILIRITGVKDYINKPNSPEIELSNSPVAGLVSNDLDKPDANEVITDNQHKNAVSFTQRRFRDAKETQEMLAQAFLNFSAGVNPIWVQTMSLLVGEESLQFQFVNNRTEAKEVDHPFYYNDTTKVFETSSGIIQHLTLGIDTISSEHKPSEYKFWDITSYTSPPLDDPSPLYLYTKCDKEGSTGSFLLSKTAYKMDQEPGYYYFLTGALGAEVEGIRSFATVYGFTEVGPGWIRVKQIISPDGKTYFNVAMGEIGGKLVLKAGSSGLKELAEWTGVDKEIKDAQKTADKAVEEIADANKALGEFQDTVNGSFKDGIISEAEAIAIEKYINTLNKEKSDVDAQYAKLFANGYLAGLAKTNLLNAKITYNGAHQELISTVNTAIVDGKTTVAEKNAVDAAFIVYSSALSNLSSRIQEANMSIQDKLKGFSETALEQADEAKQAAANAQTAANNAKASADASVNRLNNWASDSYISPTEKTALKQQKNEILAEYQEIAGQVSRYYLSYTSIWSSYYNVYLSAITSLDKYTASSPENIIVESDYGNIAAYYPYRKSMLDAIAAAAKKYVDDTIADIGDPTAGLKELEYLKTAIANETASIGGLLLTSLLKLGIKSGSTWTEKAGINGTARNNSDVIAWFGGTLSQAINNTAAIVFHLDGSGQLAKGNIKWFVDGSGQLAGGNITWNASGNAAFKGKVSTADSGSRIVLNPSYNRIELYTDSRLAGYIDFTTDDFKGITPRFTTTYSDGLGTSYTGGGMFSSMDNARYALNAKDGLHVGYMSWSTSPTNAHFSAMWRYVGSNPRMVLHLHQPPRTADGLTPGDIYVDSSNNLKWVP